VPQALRIADPQRAGYTVRWPICGPNFNLRDYPSLQVVLSDIEFLIRKTLKDKFRLDPKDFKVGFGFPMLYTSNSMFSSGAGLFCNPGYTRLL